MDIQPRTFHKIHRHQYHPRIIFFYHDSFSVTSPKRIFSRPLIFDWRNCFLWRTGLVVALCQIVKFNTNGISRASRFLENQSNHVRLSVRFMVNQDFSMRNVRIFYVLNIYATITEMIIFKCGCFSMKQKDYSTIYFRNLVSMNSLSIWIEVGQIKILIWSWWDAMRTWRNV